MRARLEPSFVERTAGDLLNVFEQSLYAERSAARDGFLQRLDARAKIVSSLLLVIGVAACRSIAVIAALFAFVIVMALFSRVSLRVFAMRTWSQVLALTSVIAIPALFVTPGRVIAALPGGLSITAEGLRTAALLVLRVETIATLAMLLIVTTAWTEVLRGLRGVGIPSVVVVIVSMTYRQLFILLQRAQEMFVAARSRTLGEVRASTSRRLALASAGSLLSRSMQTSEDVYLAMQSRGFTGEVRTLDEPALRAIDLLVIVASLALAVLAIWAGALR